MPDSTRRYEHSDRITTTGTADTGSRSQERRRRQEHQPKQAKRPDPATAGLDQPRLAARDVLRAVRERDAYANLVLPGLLRDRKLDARDAALATELAYGAARAQGLLDAVIAHAAGRPIEEIDGTLLDVLRLGSYQLLRTRVAPHAAVATSVDLVRAENGQGRAGFVNAVLRRVSERTQEEWVELLAPKDPVGRLAFEHAHPLWIAQVFADSLGAAAGELEDVLIADDARPAVHLVARPGEISAEELALVTGGEIGPYSPYAVHLDGGDPGQLEAVRQAWRACRTRAVSWWPAPSALLLSKVKTPDAGSTSVQVQEEKRHFSVLLPALKVVDSTPSSPSNIAPN